MKSWCWPPCSTRKSSTFLILTNSADQLVCSATECQAVTLFTSVCGIFLDDLVHFTAYLCCPPGCLLSVHSCLLKLAVQGSRCWKRMSLSSTVSRRSQVGKVLRVSLCYLDLLLPSCCFKQDLSLLFRDKVHRIGRPSAIWDWCSLKKNLWDLFRFCLEEPFLLSGNANQASQIVTHLLSIVAFLILWFNMLTLF